MMTFDHFRLSTTHQAPPTTRIVHLWLTASPQCVSLRPRGPLAPERTKARATQNVLVECGDHPRLSRPGAGRGVLPVGSRAGFLPTGPGRPGARAGLGITGVRS